MLLRSWIPDEIRKYILETKKNIDPPYTKEEVDSWGVKMSDRLYEYLTEISKTIIGDNVRHTIKKSDFDKEEFVIGYYGITYEYKYRHAEDCVIAYDKLEIGHKQGTIEQYIIKSINFYNSEKTGEPYEDYMKEKKTEEKPLDHTELDNISNLSHEELIRKMYGLDRSTSTNTVRLYPYFYNLMRIMNGQSGLNYSN